MITLPMWMAPRTRPDDWSTAPAPRARGRRPNLVRQALGTFARLLADLAGDAAIARRPGLLQGIDARAKVLGLIGLVVVLTLVHDLRALLLAYAGCAGLAAASRIPPARLLRAWLAIPLFSGLIILPATLNLITDGAPVWTLWHLSRETFGPWRLPETLCVTDAGLLVAGRFLLRVGACVTLATLLATTTLPARLFAGLRALAVPPLFITLLVMMHRYLEAIVRAATEIHLAKLSRTVQVGTLRQEQAWTAAGMGALFRRTQRLGQAIVLAMLSRGFTGEVRTLAPPRFRARDWAFLGAMAALSTVLLWMGRYRG